jgi:hypothetical protein
MWFVDFSSLFCAFSSELLKEKEENKAKTDMEQQLRRGCWTNSFFLSLLFFYMYLCYFLDIVNEQNEVKRLKDELEENAKIMSYLEKKTERELVVSEHKHYFICLF